MSAPKNSDLEKIVTWLDDYLQHDSIPDYPTAYNGLQVANSGNVQSVAAAVDASLDTIKKAVEEKVDLLVVHHGLYWQGVEMLTGSWREKCKLLLDNDIAVYSSHIPLDIHPEIGNNFLLAKELGLTEIEHCLDWKGVKIAVKGKINKHRDEFRKTVETKVGVAPFVCYRGSEVIDEIFIITGGAGTQIKSIHEFGGGNFLSGEGTQWTVPYAEEKGMNYILANHYATEIFGIKTLCGLIAKKFKINKEIFIRQYTQL